MKFWLTVVAIFLASFDVWARETVVVDLQDISRAVQKEFEEQGLGDEVELEFFGGQTEFILKNAESSRIMITGLDVGAGQNKFTAKAEIFADGNPVAQTKLYGRYFIIVEAFLPAKDLEKGAIITKESLIKTTMRSNRLREDMVIREDDLVGKQVIRPIKADKPVQVKDIRDEVLVEKGSVVTALYQHKGLQILSKLEALEDGSKGQNIKLLNSKSGKEVTAKVVEKNMVEIAAE